MSLRSQKRRAAHRKRARSPWKSDANRLPDAADAADAADAVDDPIAAAVFPILYADPSGGPDIDPANQGTAFLIDVRENEPGHGCSFRALFLTAKHVVETHDDVTKPYSVLIFRPDGSCYKAVVAALELHPTLDVAIGFVGLHEPHRTLTLAAAPLGEGDEFAAYGYPGTDVVEAYDFLGKHTSFNYHPSKVHGAIFGIIDSQSCYVHRSPLVGGISGGPLVSAADNRVYAITSRGIPNEYELAIRTSDLSPWQPLFLGGRALGELMKR